MAYQAWSVVFAEQPSASKWNILGTNDASFNDGSGLAFTTNNVVPANALKTNTITLGTSTSSSSANVTNSLTQLLTLTVTVPAGGRDVLLVADLAYLTGSGASETATIFNIKESTTELMRKRIRTYVSIDNCVPVCQVKLSAPSAGSHTYTYNAQNDGAVTTVAAAASTYPMSLTAYAV